MSTPGPSNLWQRDDRFAILASHAIISLMMACLVVSIVQVGELASQEFQGDYLVGLGFLVALEAMISRHAVGGRTIFDPEGLLYRGAEWVVILLAVKLGYYVQHGFGQLLVDAPRWPQDFTFSFLTQEYIIGCLVMAFIWALCNGLAEDLLLLEADERILLQEAESGIAEQRDKVREGLVSKLLATGVGMIVLAALLRSSRLTSWLDLPAMRAGVANLLLYFLLFLVLLSLTQFSLMRTHWLRERLAISEQVSRRWLFYSFILILALVILSRLLPTGYSIGLLAVLGYLFSLLIFIIYVIGNLIIAPFLLLIFWLLSLFKLAPIPQPQVQVPPAPPPVALTEPGAMPWLALLKSILFWAILLGVVGYSLACYVRERQDLLQVLRRLPFFASLARFWRWLAGLAGGVQRGVNAVLEAGLDRLRLARRGEHRPQLPGYLSLRRLSPRQRILFYYLAMVRRGGEAGLARQPSQTPYEYAHSLSQGLDLRGALPTLEEPSGETGMQVEQDIRAITERFVEARYSLHPVSTEQVGLVQRCWQRIRRALRVR